MANNEVSAPLPRVLGVAHLSTSLADIYSSDSPALGSPLTTTLNTATTAPSVPTTPSVQSKSSAQVISQPPEDIRPLPTPSTSSQPHRFLYLLPPPPL